MKFSKPLLVVSSTVLIASLTACGDTKDTSQLLPDPTSTIGLPINTESASPSASSAPSPSKSGVRTRPEPGSSDLVQPGNASELSPEPASQQLQIADFDLTMVRAIYFRNLQILAIDKIVQTKSPTPEVQAIAQLQASLVKSQNTKIAKLLKQNNLAIPTLEDRLPDVVPGSDLNFRERDISNLSTARESSVDSSYYSLLRSNFSELRVVVDEFKDRIKDKTAKAYVNQARTDDDMIVSEFSKYLATPKRTP